MLKLRISETGSIHIVQEMTSPIVYLDYCVICNLAKGKDPGDKFREILLRKKGTLYLSRAHLIEIFGLGLGPTYRSIKAYLASFESSFGIVDCNATQVIEREEKWVLGDQNPAFGVRLLKGLVSQWNGLSEINAGILLKGLEEDPTIMDKWKSLHKSHKENMHSIFLKARKTYRSNTDVKKKLDNKEYISVAGPPTKYLYDQLLRECIITNEDFNETDVLDFEHSVVSTAYSDFVVLDKKWARRLRNLNLPPTAGKVFDTREICKFLNDLEEFNSF